MNVSARLVCTNVNDFGGHREVFFQAVYSDNKDSPNYSYSQATPQASLRMVITNPAAFSRFRAGVTYDLAFSEYQIPTS